MNKRHFLNSSLLGAMGAVAGAAALPGLAHAQHAPKSATGPILLTVSGAIGAGNRGALDPALDRLMASQKLSFAKAHVFDFAALTALPAVTIQPTLLYDRQPHTLKGPLLSDVMQACGVTVSEKNGLLRSCD